MTSQEAALVELARLLEEAGIGYMLVGGHANAVWGEPRATIDVDVTVWATESESTRIVGSLQPQFRCLVADHEAFVRDTRVLPFQSLNGVRVDLIFGLLPFEQNAIERARFVTIGNRQVRVCSPEDLILMKIISERPRDLDDARGVALARFAELDLEYLVPRIRELADLLAKPAILELWDSWKNLAMRNATR